MTDHMEVQNLTKRFGDILATDDVSFGLSEGEFVSILGPSGSGKTTILRMIGGFETPSEGKIIIENEDITDTAPFERDVNTVFQQLALFPHLSVKENISYGLNQSEENYSKDERDGEISEMLELVDLAGYEDRDIDELSGGEQQRVALARALVNKPKLLLLDEPLASLDRKLRQRMQVELQYLQETTGITFLYVTHDQNVALSISDRMIVLNRGRIEQMGTTEELYQKPENAFVANFLGDINRVETTIMENSSDGTIEVSIQDNIFSISPITANGFEPRTDDQIDLCIRPHDIHFEQELSDKADYPHLKAEIRARTFKGDSFSYELENEETDITVENIDERLETGMNVYAYWEGSKTYIFPSDATSSEVSQNV